MLGGFCGGRHYSGLGGVQRPRRGARSTEELCNLYGAVYRLMLTGNTSERYKHSFFLEAEPKTYFFSSDREFVITGCIDGGINERGKQGNQTKDIQEAQTFSTMQSYRKREPQPRRRCISDQKSMLAFS